MNRKGADETRVRRRASLRSDAYGIGGFFEAIMAMVIVTSGLLLLTFSLTLLSVDDGEGSEDLDHRCESTLNSILDDPAWSRGSMMLDHRDLARADWTSFKGEGGAKVILTYPDGTTEVLHQQGKVYDGERSCRSAPVNIYFHQADVRAALITVWVWA
jgi:hypothetical protein